MNLRSLRLRYTRMSDEILRSQVFKKNLSQLEHLEVMYLRVDVSSLIDLISNLTRLRSLLI